MLVYNKELNIVAEMEFSICENAKLGHVPIREGESYLVMFDGTFIDGWERVEKA